jgi:serine/threonine-protein kinase
LALTPFSTLHLALAGVAVLLAVVHLSMWIALRHETAHGWVAASLAGYAAFDLTLAGASSGADGGLGPVWIWFVVAVPTAIILPLALFRTCWAVLDLPVEGARRAVLWGALVLLLPEAGHGVWLLQTGQAATLTWEAVRYTQLQVAIPYLFATSLIGLVWIFEAWRCRKTVGFTAWAAVVVAIPAVGVMTREWFLLAGRVDGPSGVGLTALPLVLFASASMVGRYVRAVREAGSSVEADERYLRLHRLGRGGMGEVWLGMRRSEGGFQRWVVLKRIRVDVVAEDLLARFWAEARVAARLHHPNVVAVHDFGKFDGGWFIVMEYLAGVSLFDVLVRAYDEQKAIPPEVIVAVGEQVCRGLDCAHTHGVLHRDISPDNVIVTFDGETKVVDFGIAKEADRRDETSEGHADASLDLTNPQTVPGGIAGKRRYLAPERLAGDPAGPESDIYSVALVMLEMFGVALPECGADMAGTPAPLSDAGLAAPGGIEAVLRRALAPHPKQRFRSAAAFGDELRLVLREMEPVDLGAYARRTFPERYDATHRLLELDDPKAAQVQDLLGEVAAAAEFTVSTSSAGRPAGVPTPTLRM